MWLAELSPRRFPVAGSGRVPWLAPLLPVPMARGSAGHGFAVTVLGICVPVALLWLLLAASSRLHFCLSGELCVSIDATIRLWLFSLFFFFFLIF